MTMKMGRPASSPRKPPTPWKGCDVSIAQDEARRNIGVRVPVDAGGVHEELKSFDHWVMWKAVPRPDGKLDKVPYDAKTGAHASTTDSRTWATFGDAAAAYQTGGYDGLGFVFSSADPFTGIDLDGVRDPESGELEDWARTAVDRFDGYAEISPSGEGVHIYVKGRVASRKNSAIEVYSAARFFTVTGVRP
jgi:putative DNA primase/helicase